MDGNDKLRKATSMKHAIRFILLTLFAATMFAQVSITVTVTVPASAAPIVTDWMATQCATYNADGVTCATLLYPTAKSLVQSIVQTAINNQLAGIYQWAIATGNANLAAAVKTAVVAKQTAQAALQAAQTTAATATVVTQ